LSVAAASFLAANDLVMSSRQAACALRLDFTISPRGLLPAILFRLLADRCDT
jgi:hypothetical protein